MYNVVNKYLDKKIKIKYNKFPDQAGRLA